MALAFGSDAMKRTVGGEGVAFVRFADAQPSHGVTVRAVFSDESVARDGHTIKTAGIDLQAFMRNPVLLWAHDSSQPPIGRVTEISKSGTQLVGAVEFTPQESNPFGATIGQLFRGGYLSAFSISWLPVEWKYSTDKNRSGGIDFNRVELLEISAVPVPALSTALATARARGIDVRPVERALARSSETTRGRRRHQLVKIREQIHRGGLDAAHLNRLRRVEAVIKRAIRENW